MGRPKKATAANKSKSTALKPEKLAKTLKSARVRRPFPLNTLEDALAVALAIKTKNNGKPFDTEDLAKACDRTRKSTTFYYLAAAARDYGLTDGSRDTATISLTELGQRIVYPESAEDQRLAKVDAFLKVKLFKDVFDHYGGGTLPENQFVSSVLYKRYGLEESLHDEFYDLFQKNCRYVSSSADGDALQIVQREGESGAEAVVLAQPGEYSHQAFVIMPFSEKGTAPRPNGFFVEVLNSLIKPACNTADFGVQTAHSHGSDLIHHTIIRQLVEADLVIADLTDHNPNVLFELGIRIALDKPVLLIRAIGTLPIFDVDQMMRVCEYDPRLWKTTIETDITSITEYVKGAWENRDKNPSYMGILKTGRQSGN